jgi:hypothetical protein
MQKKNCLKWKEPDISTVRMSKSSVRIVNERDKYVNFTAGNTGLMDKQTSSAAPDSTKVNSHVHRKYCSYDAMYLLTPWSRVLLEKLTKKFPAVYGTRRFFTVLTSVRHPSLS